MKILVLGGTQFIGRNLVEALIKTSHSITLFNRGKSGTELFPSVLRIIGDRKTADIEKIKGDWDMVVDISCYYPADLESTLSQLDSSKTKYIFISTCSAYKVDPNSNMNTETAELNNCSEEEKTDNSMASYGQRKAECERVLGASGFRYSILRPALVYGQHDPTDRFYYWLHQVKTKNRIMIPDNGERVLSITYVHDLINATIRLIESDISGTYSAISVSQTSIGEFIKLASEQLGLSPTLVNATTRFLNDQNVAQWSDMPLWINGDHFTYSNEKWKNELEIETTSMKDGIRETIEYYTNLGWPEPTYGLSSKRQEELVSILEE